MLAKGKSLIKYQDSHFMHTIVLCVGCNIKNRIAIVMLRTYGSAHIRVLDSQTWSCFTEGVQNAGRVLQCRFQIWNTYLTPLCRWDWNTSCRLHINDWSTVDVVQHYYCQDCQETCLKHFTISLIWRLFLCSWIGLDVFLWFWWGFGLLFITAIAWASFTIFPFWKVRGNSHPMNITVSYWIERLFLDEMLKKTKLSYIKQ